jgi:hypothetical protein
MEINIFRILKILTQSVTPTPIYEQRFETVTGNKVQCASTQDKNVIKEVNDETDWSMQLHLQCSDDALR